MALDSSLKAAPYKQVYGALMYLGLGGQVGAPATKGKRKSKDTSMAVEDPDVIEVPSRICACTVH